MPDRLGRWENLRSEKERRILWRLHAQLPARGSFSALRAAAILLIMGVALKPIADHLVGQTLPPFIFSYPTVVIIALVGGTKIGVVAALVSIAIAWIAFLPPSWSLLLGTSGDTVALLIYSLTSLLLALAIGSARYTLDMAVASEAMRDYDAREAVHRVKNVLTVVQALTWGTMREARDLDDLPDRLSPRFSALAQAQDVLINNRQGSTTAQNLVTHAVRPFLPDSRIAVHCQEDVVVPAPFVHGLMLALFELATNSAKYGALRGSKGSITISCEHHGKDIMLQWKETSEEVASNELVRGNRDSFGRKLIQAALGNHRETDVSYECSAGRVMAAFRWPSQLTP
ncbi:MAG: hypothetical protein COW16_06190 [Sphingomonadales bacterium CG12_big_fil_rev_8_21_14_0_65_65_10]|nr:MAG: hypothetical protein COW16_06190 [Sphingomonadales bacterium CG12_big_fil_rev_8_21_14_0_65_65_10]